MVVVMMMRLMMMLLVLVDGAVTITRRLCLRRDLFRVGKKNSIIAPFT
jgi:hypothetical protein